MTSPTTQNVDVERKASGQGPPATLEEMTQDMVRIEMPMELQTTDGVPDIEGNTNSNGTPTKRGSAYGTAFRLPRLVPEDASVESNERPAYWRRRLEMWERPDEDEDAPPQPRPKFLAGSISSLPVPVQIGFRRKMLMIFVFQLLLLTVCMIILTFEPTMKDLMRQAFDEERMYILLALAVMIGLLAILYSVHAVFPLNWIVLLLFTAGLSVFLASLQVLLNSHAALFCCAFTLVAMIVMVGLSGITLRRNEKTVLLSSSIAGFISFSVTAIGALILFAVLQNDFISSAGIAYSIMVELVLIMWFSHDASTMYSLISPDEYMNGVIYFYTDLIVLAVISLFFGAVILFCSACGTASGFGYCDFYACMHAGGGDAGGGDMDDVEMGEEEAAGEADEMSAVSASGNAIDAQS